MMKPEINKQLLDEMRKNPDNWKGVFYVNRKDPRLFVPKLNPALGTTLNFGNTYAVIGLITIVAIIVGWQVFF